MLLAMQKVEGSNPFSRFRKGLHLQAFFGYASRIVRLHNGGSMRTGGPVHRGAAPKVVLLRAFAGDSNH